MENSLASYLGRLQHAKNQEFGEALEEFLGTSHTVEKAVEIIIKRLDEGIYVLDDQLVTLILKSHSPTLYSKVREQLLKNHWAMLKLYRAEYPDPEIERDLLRRLYTIAPNDGDPLRGYIVEAMGDVGSWEVLPTLEAVLFDLEPSAKVQEIFSDSLKLDLVGRLSAQSRTEFVKSVARAIEAVADRVASAEKSFVSTSQQGTLAHVGLARSADESDPNIRACEIQARRYCESYPNLTLFFIRLGAEALAKDLYRRLGHEVGGKPARKMMLDDLLKSVRESPVPEVLKILIQTFQTFGNFGSHDQDNQWEHLTKETASALCTLYGEALIIYSRWKEEPRGS